MEDFVLTLSHEEKIRSICDSKEKILRILHVYEKSLEDKSYNYKSYVYAVVLFVSSFNSLINFDLTEVLVQLNSLLINDFDKSQIRKIVFECRHIMDRILKEVV